MHPSLLTLATSPWLLLPLSAAVGVAYVFARACRVPDPGVPVCARCTRECPRLATRWRLGLVLGRVIGGVLGFVPLALVAIPCGTGNSAPPRDS